MKKLFGLFFAFILMLGIGGVAETKANIPVGCYMYMANCSGEKMSLKNCKKEHTAEGCASGAICNNC